MILHPPRAVIFVDADNTLWDTDGVFAAAQLKFLADVEAEVSAAAPGIDRLAYVRALDQALAERHHAGLRYPPRLLAKALALALTGKQPDVAIRLAWSGGRETARISDAAAERIEVDFFAALTQPPELRPGVRSGLTRLTESGHLVLVLTEGNREKALRIAQLHGLDRSFHRVIEAKKDQRLFDRVLRLTGRPSAAFMVGDQLERDMRPAKAAGLRTIFFPSGFRPKWEPAEIEVLPDYRINSFDEVPPIVEDTIRSGMTREAPKDKQSIRSG